MLEQAARRVPMVPARDWMRALPPATRLIFNGRTAAREKASMVWGVGFSENPCRAMSANGRATLWLGPDEFLLLQSPAQTPFPVAAEIGRALTDVPHALVDVSHRQFAIELSGNHAATILNGACPLDLDLESFPIDMCTRTAFAKADIVLWRTAAQTFHVEVWRSFSGYVTGLLTEIGEDFDDL
jgi:sarcosine oxidase subunit gamma